MFEKTTVTCTDTDKTVGADILAKSDRQLKVALDETDITITLFKQTPTQRLYVGKKLGLEFTSAG